MFNCGRFRPIFGKEAESGRDDAQPYRDGPVVTGSQAALHPMGLPRARTRPPAGTTARRVESAVHRSDTDLTADLALARTGDELAFSRVYRAVQPGLHRYLTALVGADADDVAAETWAQAVAGLDGFRGDIDGFRGWIARIGRNRAIDHVRAMGRRPVAAATDEVLLSRACGADTEAAAIAAVSTEWALALIASLPPDQAEAVLLRAVMGLDAASAAAVLGKRAGAVRTAAHRGLRTLAAKVHGEDDGTGCDVFTAAVADEVR